MRGCQSSGDGHARGRLAGAERDFRDEGKGFDILPHRERIVKEELERRSSRSVELAVISGQTRAERTGGGGVMISPPKHEGRQRS
jgi:hypothetical protein